MVLMTLDHTRDFFGDTFFSATDPGITTVPLFVSRWITHLCAPTFLLLAGSSIWMQTLRGDSYSVFRFILIRGLILVALELTVVHLVWYFHLDMHYAVAGVIWATGWSMVLLAILLKVINSKPDTKRMFLLWLGIVLLAGLPVLSLFVSPNAGVLLLISTDDIVWGDGFHFYTSYPVLPWFALMAIGYFLGQWFQLPTETRNKRFGYAGIVLICSFAFVRLINTYGDPAGWQSYDQGWRSILSFLNVSKYPPSPDYVLLTVGLMMVMFPFLEKLPAFLSRFLTVLGKAPLAYYVLHLLVLHLCAVLYASVAFGRADFLLQGPEIFWYEHLSGHPEGYGFSLAVVCAITLVVSVTLYPVLSWYSMLKRRHPGSWLRFF